MIKQFCDYCGQEISGDIQGYSELDKFYVEGTDSYHFHIQAVGLLLDSNCFEKLLLQAFDVSPPSVEEAVEEEEEEEEEEPTPEPKPIRSGNWLGQISPKGQWSWQGTGDPSDDWKRIGHD